MHLRFGETESAFDYMMATREYLEQHGKPLAFYSDKHGIFRVNNGGSTTTGVTQFGRVLSELGIELICANSPQAKGRVERANQTLQDRLTKDMCLEGISSIEAANAAGYLHCRLQSSLRKTSKIPQRSAPNRG